MQSLTTLWTIKDAVALISSDPSFFKVCGGRFLLFFSELFTSIKPAHNCLAHKPSASFLIPDPNDEPHTEERYRDIYLQPRYHLQYAYLY